MDRYEGETSIDPLQETLVKALERPEIAVSERRQLGVPDRITTAEWLDITWRRFAENGDDMAQSLQAKFHETARLFEEQLGELRDYARMKLTEEREAKHTN